MSERFGMCTGYRFFLWWLRRGVCSQNGGACALLVVAVGAGLAGGVELGSMLAGALGSGADDAARSERHE
jgi:hypothetical protein